MLRENQENINFPRWTVKKGHFPLIVNKINAAILVTTNEYFNSPLIHLCLMFTIFCPTEAAISSSI